VKKLIRKILRFTQIGRIIIGHLDLSLLYLKNEGWNNSVKKSVPLNAENKPLPWFTYPSIHFLKDRIKKDFTVFEFGSGNSTLWFSSRVHQIISLEHDVVWYNLMKDKFAKLSNIDYKFKNIENGEYANEILNYTKHFDIIVIDGRDRINCCKNSLPALKDNGVIIFDNSERKEYSEGYELFLKNDFRRIDFWGLGPINSHSWCTSIFYRNNNCLGI
jgi:hypothetical protein